MVMTEVMRGTGAVTAVSINDIVTHVTFGLCQPVRSGFNLQITHIQRCRGVS